MADESILRSLEERGHSAPRLNLRSAAGDAAPEPPLPRLKESGRYEILGEIAQGGVGIVLKGRDVDLGRDVALKVLRPGHVDKPELLQRFVEEAQIGGQLQHPGIVPVYELGLGRDRRPFFAMKLVKGRTLAALLAERKEPAADRRKFLAIFERVCQTLAYAHTRGVVHRDLKPSNVMIGPFAEVQVVDWGFAKVLAQGGVADERRAARKAPDVTQIATVRSAGEGSDSIPGSVMGTPAYMPPEQALGHVDDLDERSDVFSLGAILCEILTGEPPYTGQDLLVKAAQCRLEGAYGKLDGCGADEELVGLCKRCLSPMREQRPRDAGAVAFAVQAHVASVEERARRSALAAIESREKAALVRARADEERALAVAARRRAEEERAAAERARDRAALAIAEAAAARRAKRQTLVLAAAILLAIGAGAGGWIWIERDAGLRREGAVRAVNEAMQEANVLRGGRQWAAAASAAQKAKDLARTGGADEGTLGRADALLAAVAAEARAFEEALEQRKRDAELLSRLEEIRARGYDEFDHAKADTDYGAAFREYGVDFDSVSTEAAVAWIRARSNALELVAIVDVWARERRVFAKRLQPEWKRLVDAAKAADPDLWRNKVRDAAAGGDAAALLEMASSPEIAAQPPETQSLLEMSLRELDKYEAAVSLLRKAQRRNPGVLWINESLGYGFHRLSPPQWAEAARFHTAALAIRPQAGGLWSNLGVALINKGDLVGAIEAGRRAVALSPNNAGAHNNLGAALLRKGEIDMAVESFRAAIGLDPGYGSAHGNLGSALVGKGRVDEAIAACREGIRLDPNFAMLRVSLGFALWARGLYDEAIAAYREAIRLEPDLAMAHCNLGNCLLSRGSLDESIACCREAIRLDPQSAAAHAALGDALAEAKDMKGAVEAYKDAIRIDPNDTWTDHKAQLHYNLGLALRQTGDNPAAIKAFRAAIARKPDFAEAHRDLGDALRDAGNTDDALAECREAVRLKRDFAEAHNSIGVLLCDVLHDFDGAIASFREAIRLKPDFAYAHHNLGIALTGKGDSDVAIASFREAIRLSPDEPNAHYRLGVLLDFAGNQDAAAAAYRNVILLKPDFAGAHSNLGRLLFRAGDTDGAFAEYREAIRCKPDLANAHHGLGTMLWVEGKDPDGAVRELREAVRLGPSDPVFHYTLGDVLFALAEWDGAILEYREAFRLDPNLEWAEIAIGSILEPIRKVPQRGT